MKTIIRTFLLAAATATMISCGNNKAAKQAVAEVEELPTVTETIATVKTVAQEGVYTSTVQAYAINNIAPQSPNRIKKILVDVGDYVVKGQKVAEMDVLSLNQVKMQLANDSTELSRIRALYEEGGVSQSEFDAIKLGYEVRKTNYENLKENTILTAPINGVITARNYDVGDMFMAQKPLFIVQQITPVKLLVGISESMYSMVKKGDNVTVKTDAFPDLVFDGKVSKIYPTIDPATRTFTAEVRVANNYKTLRPGMFARVKVSFGDKEHVVIPDIAVVKLQGSGERFVYVIDENNTVSFRKILLGQRLGAEYEVLEGIEDGEHVVIKGQQRLKDGSKVKVLK